MQTAACIIVKMKMKKNEVKSACNNNIIDSDMNGLGDGELISSIPNRIAIIKSSNEAVTAMI